VLVSKLLESSRSSYTKDFKAAMPHHLFPIYNQSLVANPEIGYPRQSEIIPTWADGLISVPIPIVVMAPFQIHRRSIEDWLTTVLGLLKRK